MRLRSRRLRGHCDDGAHRMFARGGTGACAQRCATRTQRPLRLSGLPRVQRLSTRANAVEVWHRLHGQHAAGATDQSRVAAPELPRGGHRKARVPETPAERSIRGIGKPRRRWHPSELSRTRWLVSRRGFYFNLTAGAPQLEVHPATVSQHLNLCNRFDFPRRRSSAVGFAK